jgi:hypothetical protein
MELQISRSQRESVRLLLGLVGREMLAVVDAFKTASAMAVSDFVKLLGSKIGREPDAIREIVSLLVRLEAQRVRMDWDSQQFATEFCRVSRTEKLGPEGIDWEVTQQAIGDIFACEQSLGVMSRAWSISQDNPRVFLDAGIGSSLRLVSTEGADARPVAGMIVHTLRLDFLEDSDQKSFYTTLDADGLRRIEEVVDLAKREIVNIQSVYALDDVPLLISSELLGTQDATGEAASGSREEGSAGTTGTAWQAGSPFERPEVPKVPGKHEPLGRREKNARKIDAIHVGRVRYPLRSAMSGRFIQAKDSLNFYVDNFLPRFVGKGPTEEQAFQDWCEHIHVVVQRLLATPEALRTDDERAQWDLLSRQIDFPAYDRARPLKTRQCGVVLHAWPDPWSIQWTDGRVERVPLEIMPDEFAAFEPGDWLEAVVDCDPVSRSLLYVHAVQPIDPQEEMGPDEATGFWQSLAQRDDLPESNRDWTQ